VAFVQSLLDNFLLIAGIVLTLLVGKGIAAELAGRACSATPGPRG
jgi:hypothetical protein